MDNFRNFSNAKSEARRLRESCEKHENFDDLLRVGMGKETRSEILNWLNGLGYNLSRRDLTDHLVSADIPNEIRLILEQLKSRESKLIPVDDVPEMIGIDESDEGSLEFEEGAS